MKGKRLTVLLIVLAVAVAAGFAVYAAGAYGSQEDPLITKSYLDSVVQPELERAFQEELEKAVGQTKSTGGDFELVTLRSGQRVTAAVGTELLLRFGSARAYAYDSADVALVDTTAAQTLSNGTALTANHLYMVTIRGNGFTASADNTKVLISGEYTVE